MEHTITLLQGKTVQPYASLIKSWRINYFKTFPYLYKGDDAYEENYLSGFLNNSKSVLAVAMANSKPIGLATALPLESDYEIVEACAPLFWQSGFQASKYFYLGEIIVHPDCRGKGIARELMQYIESYSKSNGYRGNCFLCVIRDGHHPLKPIAYKSSDPVWQKLGYTQSSMVTGFNWPTIQPDGSVQDMHHDMVFWLKHF